MKQPLIEQRMEEDLIMYTNYERFISAIKLKATRSEESNYASYKINITHELAISNFASSCSLNLIKTFKLGHFNFNPQSS